MEGEIVFTKSGSTPGNRLLLPRHILDENSIQEGRTASSSILAPYLKYLNIASHESALGITSDAYYSRGGDCGQLHRLYRNNFYDHVHAFGLDEDGFLKVCFVAWKLITKGRRLNDRKMQLDRFESILQTKAELDVQLHPEKLKRNGTIKLYSILRMIRVALLRVNFAFWRDVSGLMRRKLARFFDKWNVWASALKLKKMTATRFCEIVKGTHLMPLNRRTFKRLAFDKWISVGSYLLEMRIVRLLFRSWKTLAIAANDARKLRVKVALREWYHIAMETAEKREKAIGKRHKGTLMQLWVHWKHYQAQKVGRREAITRINSSNLSKISSTSSGRDNNNDNDDSGIVTGGSLASAQHNMSGMSLSSISGAAANNSNSNISVVSGEEKKDGDGEGEGDVSVLQKSLSEDAYITNTVDSKTNTAASPSPPLRGGLILRNNQGIDTATTTPTRALSKSTKNTRTRTINTPGSAGSRRKHHRPSSSSSSFTPRSSMMTRNKDSRETLWEMRMQSLKSMDSSFQTDTSNRLRASGLFPASK